jgi:hypothetical protein
MHSIGRDVFASRIKIMPHVSVIYSQNLIRAPRKNPRPQMNKSLGNVSQKAKSKILSTLNWMLLFSDRKHVYSKAKKRGFFFRINFITLTLAQAQTHSDKYILDHMLQPFLLWMQRKHNAWNYVWKAEIQPARLANRGERCIHFHITTNKFIHYNAIRQKWNQLQAAHGYCTEEENPNSTDVHSVIKTGAIVKYFAKYVAKAAEKPELKVHCKVWGCNYNLSRMNCTLAEETHNDFWDNVSSFHKQFATGMKAMEHATLHFLKFTVNDLLPYEIGMQLRKNYEIFNTRDDGMKKYTID